MAAKKILVTGGGTFLGDHIAIALLIEGAEVTLLVRSGMEERLGNLKQHARIRLGDAWDPASLRGQARGYDTVINTIGSMNADPENGLTFQRLNFVSARNITNMCVTDGVPRLVLLSAANALWINRAYLRSKREAESYTRRVGMQTSIIRAPITYIRGQKRPLFYQFVSLIGSFPPLSLLLFRHSRPMPVDVLARAVARIALTRQIGSKIYYPRDLWKLNTRAERRGNPPDIQGFGPDQRGSSSPLEAIGEDIPFGWEPLNNYYRK